MNKIFWKLLIHNEWKLYIAATEKELCYIGSPNKPFEEMEMWLTKRFPKLVLVGNDEVVEVYTNQIQAYLDGERSEFRYQDLNGTAFQLAVWDALTKIPYGEKKSYSEIANMIQNPKAVRAVGAAIGANPVLMTIPCHRVVAKNGALTGFRGGLEMKEKLLALESGINK